MRAKLRFPFRSWHNDGGSVPIEFALIATVLMIGTLGVFDLGRLLFTYHTLATAVGSTTRLVQMQAPEDAIISSISSRFSPSEQQALTIDIDPTVIIGGATYTRVDAQFSLHLIAPGLGIFSGNPYILHASQLVPTS